MKTQIFLLTDAEIAQIVGGAFAAAKAGAPWVSRNPLLTTLDNIFGARLGGLIDKAIVQEEDILGGGSKNYTGSGSTTALAN